MHMKKYKQLVSISLFFTFFLSFTFSYKTYCNERFHYCVEYPLNFLGKGESSNGDGQEFTSADKKAVITTYGILVHNFSDFKTNLETEYTNILKTKRVTYKVKSRDYFIVSGIENDGRIFYRKSKKVKDYYDSESENVITLEIVYPKSQIKIYNSYCKKISKSL